MHSKLNELIHIWIAINYIPVGVNIQMTKYPELWIKNFSNCKLLMMYIENKFKRPLDLTFDDSKASDVFPTAVFKKAYVIIVY